MLDFLQNEYTNDFGLQWNDTTCDWRGWLGYSADDGYDPKLAFTTYREDTLKELLKVMVLSIKYPKWEENKNE